MQNNFFFLSKSCYENNYLAIDQNKIKPLTTINLACVAGFERGRG